MGYLVLSSVVADGEMLGDLVIRWISETPPPAYDVLVRSQRMLGGELVDEKVLCLLAWLQHVSQSLVKSPQYGANPVWVRRDLRSVVERAPALLERPRPVPAVPAFAAPTRPAIPVGVPGQNPTGTARLGAYRQ
jgi:hypothetical protein